MIKTNNIERNRLDYLLTDIMPVEVSELFSYGAFYEYLFSRQKELDAVIDEMQRRKALNGEVPFSGGWGTWASVPLKYGILKGTSGRRELNLVQPLGALNMYLFVACYQKEILNQLQENSCFSLRYHRKNTDLHYTRRDKRASDYFVKASKQVKKNVLQQTGAFFKLHKYRSVSDFTSSRCWKQCNFQYRYFAKVDYKSCFDSIYTHAFKWCVVKDTVDSKEANNANVHIVIDRILQNINGRSSNGVIIGPEFSRMMAEILLQQIDVEVKYELAEKGLEVGRDYRVFRYVDDIFIFSNSQEDLDRIIATIERVSQRYLLRLNELKYLKTATPVVLSTWLGKTRELADRIGGLFYRKHELHEMQSKGPLLKKGYISLDRLKNDFICLINDYPREQRYIVSFILTTLLNSISNKKDGYILFDPDKTQRAYVLLDLALYVYSFCPCFEHTHKVLSMLVYMDDELHFKTDELNHKKLLNMIRRYAFIFEKGNLNDLCNWFIFFYEYQISLKSGSEAVIEEMLEREDNPLLWANYLIYSQYYPGYHAYISRKLEELILQKINQLGREEIMMKREFWYILVFINCPYLPVSLRDKMADLVRLIRNENTPLKPSFAQRMNCLICDFLLQKKSNLFFCWGYYRFSVSKQLTFRTYQRTLFRQFKRKRSSELYGSLDS